MSRLRQEQYATALCEEEQQLERKITQLENELEAILDLPAADPRQREAEWNACSHIALSLPLTFHEHLAFSEHAEIGAYFTPPHMLSGQVVSLDATDLRYLLKQHEWWVTSEYSWGQCFHLKNRQLQPGISLKGAWLSHADLRGADLRGLDMRECNLIHANLQGAQLQGTALAYASLVLADLSGAVCEGANLDHANCGMARFVGSNLTRASAQFTNFQYAQLQGACLESANLQDAFLIECQLDNAILRDAQCMRANFQGASLHGTDIQGCNARSASLQDVKGLSMEKMHGIQCDSETRWPTEGVIQLRENR